MKLEKSFKYLCLIWFFTSFYSVGYPQPRLIQDLRYEPQQMNVPYFIYYSVPVPLTEAPPAKMVEAIFDPTEYLPLKEDKEQKMKASSSWIPILGYNSTYGIFGGGGYFRSKGDFSFGINGIATQTSSMKAEISL